MTRCWQYLHGCRARATNSVRIGNRVVHYCDDPRHEPKVVNQ